MRREAIKVPSILSMHETPMSPRSMLMFRTHVRASQGRPDRGSLKTQICHGLGAGRRRKAHSKRHGQLRGK
ncbi:hypothetical protein ACSS6W_010639 [Trichoderma asperelloides]